MTTITFPVRGVSFRKLTKEELVEWDKELWRLLRETVREHLARSEKG